MVLDIWQRSRQLFLLALIAAVMATRVAGRMRKSEQFANIVGDGSQKHFHGKGYSNLLLFLQSEWGQEVLATLPQVLTFYLLTLAGFGGLFLVMRNTQRILDIKKGISQAIKAERAHKFDLDDYSSRSFM